MNIQHLEYIVVISEEKTLLRASEKLFVSPSALSQFVSKLEKELNTKLFFRSKDGWEPTIAGQLYVDMAKSVINLQRKTYTEISMISNSFSNTLTIGTTPGSMSNMLATIFPAFNSRFPNIKLKLLEARTFDIVKSLDDQKLDLAFISAGDLGMFKDQQTRVQMISSENLLLSVPALYPPLPVQPGTDNDDYPVVRLEDLQDSDFMLMGPGTTIRLLEDALFAAAGFKPSIIFEASSMQTIVAFAKTGYAITLIPALYAQPTPESRYYKLSTSPKWYRFAAYPSNEPLSAPKKYMLSLATSFYRDRNLHQLTT